MFESLDAFRAHCGEPTTQLEACATCSAIPQRCDRQRVSSMVSDYDVEYGGEGHHDDVPAQVGELETLIELRRDETFTDGRRDEAVLRCPTCRRLYLYTDSLEFVGARNYSRSSYERYEVEALFRTRWCVSRRIPDRNAWMTQPLELFRHHAIVRFRGSRTWFSLDEANHLVELTSAELQRLIASDPPAGLDDAVRARWFASFVGEVEDPEVRVVDSFSEIRWRDPLTDEDRQQVDAAREASRIEGPVTEQAADHVVVRSWVISKKRLICRIVTVRETGESLREDAVIAENLPIA